jgi:LPXTG-motif cell wall-anchored protein
VQPRRGFASLAAALAAVVLPMLVLGALQTSTSDGRVVTPVTGTASTRSPTSPTGRGTHAGRTHAEPPGTRVRPRGPDRLRRHHGKHKRHVAKIKAKKRSGAASAHSAADPGVTIADFSFSPDAITLHVGDTIQWLNNGPSPHTATANNGSFDTGVLHKGQSASVTFHLPGTFAYHCSIHPFMHGTVVVLAAAKSSSTGGSGSTQNQGSSGNRGSSAGSGSASSAGSSVGSSATGASASGGNPSGSGNGSTAASTAGAVDSTGGQGALPQTGVNVLAVVALGLLLSGSGLILDRLRRRHFS